MKLKIMLISHFIPIYLRKLQEDILKYYRLDLFKEIPIDFDYNLQTTAEFPASHTNIRLV